jgi:TldD protein
VFSPTFALGLENSPSVHASKIWSRALETAVADFLLKKSEAVVEDVSILVGTDESASRAFSNGRSEGPPSFTAATNYHVRAIVSGAAGLSTGTPDPDTDPVAVILHALEDAFAQSRKNLSQEVELLASRDQIIAHVGQHAWDEVDMSADFQNVSAQIQEFHCVRQDPRLHSLKSRLNMFVEYRWQYFLDGAQQTFVTQTCRVASQATCSDAGEKRTAFGRQFSNRIMSAASIRSQLEAHFAKIAQQALALLPARLVPEDPEYDYLAVDADLLGLILHEAVGHAAEGDLIQTCSSGFGQNGQRLDLEVGPPWLNILIDGRLDNCGYLPVDAEGVVPRRKTLVRKGRLVDAIHSRHTARSAGQSPDGCSRLQSLQYPSLNRMTSIWVAPENSKSLGHQQDAWEWDDIPPHVIQNALERHGYLDGEKGVLLLSGWRGGTASCSNLEFRADVARVLHMKKGQSPELMREANFTGIATECFRSAVDAFGPVLCRSIGTCGKDGQGVLTSDGGPAFMVFRPNSKVRVIGTGEGGDEVQ